MIVAVHYNTIIFYTLKIFLANNTKLLYFRHAIRLYCFHALSPVAVPCKSTAIIYTQKNYARLAHITPRRISRFRLFSYNISIYTNDICFFSDNSSVFVAIAAILGGAFTVYRWVTVYLDRRKTQRREKELNKIVNRHIYGDDK